MPARSLSPKETETYFGLMATWVTNSGPASNKWARNTPGCAPEQVGIVADVERPDYFG